MHALTLNKNGYVLERLKVLINFISFYAILFYVNLIFALAFSVLYCEHDPHPGILVVIREISPRMSGRHDIKRHRGVALENRVILRRRVAIVLTVVRWLRRK